MMAYDIVSLLLYPAIQRVAVHLQHFVPTRIAPRKVLFDEAYTASAADPIVVKGQQILYNIARNIHYSISILS
jgi:hypothetical protein